MDRGTRGEGKLIHGSQDNALENGGVVGHTVVAEFNVKNV